MSWGAAKHILNRHMPMDVCIDALLFVQQSAEDQYLAKVNKIGFRYNARYDAEMQMLARTCSQFAYDIVKQEYKSSLSNDTTYTFSRSESEPRLFTVVGLRTENLYAVSFR